MYKFFQRNQKKMLAVLGVMLMVVFIIPSTFRGASGARGGETVIGTVGKVKVHAADEAQAKDDLRSLAQAGFQPLLGLGGRDPNNPNPRAPGTVFQMFTERPLAYALALQEAKNDGVQVSDAQVEDAMKNLPMIGTTQAEGLRPAVERFLMVMSNFERAASSIKVTKPLLNYQLASAEQSVKLNVVDLSPEQFLDKVPAPTPEQVRQQFERYGDALPTGGGFAATQPAQPGYAVPDRFKIQYLELPADQVVDAFLGKRNTWDLELAANRYYTSHPLEFRTKPEAPPTRPSTLPTTGPATAPSPGSASAAAATQPATAPSVAAATTRPTTQPFEEVKRDLLRKLLLGRAESDVKAVRDAREQYAAFSRTLRNDLRDLVAKDYQSYQSAHGGGPATRPTTLPTTQPDTSVGVPFDSFEYLEKVADAFQQQHGVRPLVTNIGNEWKSETELRSLPKLGFARSADASFVQVLAQRIHRLPGPSTAPAAATTPSTQPTTGPTTAPAAALASAAGPTTAPTTGPSTRPAGEAAGQLFTADLWAPSDVLEDTEKDAFIFRLSGYEPQHRPALQEAEAQIAKDLKAAAAFEMARAEANRLLAAVQAADAKNPPPEGSLPAAASASGYRTETTGPVPMLEFSMLSSFLKSGRQVPLMQQFEIARQLKVEGYAPENPLSKFTFLAQLAPIATRANAKEPHPAGLVDLPADRKVLVAEVAGFELGWSEAQDYARRLSIAQQNRKLFESQFANDWFNYDNVVSRIGFKKA